MKSNPSAAALLVWAVLFPPHAFFQENSVSFSTSPARSGAPAPMDERTIRGIHITAWWAGSRSKRAYLLENIKNSVVNAVVVAVKETDGRVYLPGVTSAEEYGSALTAIKYPGDMISDFKGAGLYTIARIVTFRDDFLPEKLPWLAVKTTNYATPWRNRNGGTWLDPYDKRAWEYNLTVARRAAELGFDEVQFDYIRYPSEGDISLCRYSREHNEKNATANLRAFLAFIRENMPRKIKISAAVFGLTTTAKDDLGIGQNIKLMAEKADWVYPMMYPSHYRKESYGLKNPDARPFKTIDYGLKDARKNLGDSYGKITPYLQDFTLGYKYGPHEVRIQILAAKLNGISRWVLWNASNDYNWEALTPQSYRNFIDPDFP